MKDKVQTTHAGKNILVETTNESRHSHPTDKLVTIVDVLTNAQIIELYKARMPEEDIIRIAIDWLAHQPEFAKSNVRGGEHNLKYGDLIQFTYK